MSGLGPVGSVFFEGLRCGVRFKNYILQGYNLGHFLEFRQPGQRSGLGDIETAIDGFPSDCFISLKIVHGPANLIRVFFSKGV